MNAFVNLNECPDYITFEVDGQQNHVRIVGTNEEPWFCGRDLCVVLEYEHQKKALQTNVDEDCKKSLSKLSSEVGNLRFPTILGRSNLENISYNEGKTVYINEAGLYSLIIGSRAQMAKQFRSLVCKEILPAIRKYGTYSINKQLETATKQLEQLSLENKEQEQKLQDQAVALEIEEDKRLRAERKSLRIAKLMKHASIKEKKEEWIYIATTALYARDRIFKIGSTERLHSRIEGYQTGRPKEDKYYYAFIKKVYTSKDLDYHIQRLLADFKHNERGEMYIGIKFEDLCDILNVICDNYDRSLEYVYGFVKARLPSSQEEAADEPPPAIDLNRITVHFGEHEEEIVLSEESVRNLLQDILSGLEGSTVNNVVVYQRKDLIEELEKIFVGSKRKSIWEVTKKAIGWKSSKSDLGTNGEVYKIQY